MYPGFIPHWKRRHCGSRYAAADPEGRGGGYGERGWRSGWEYSLSPEEDPAALGFGSGAFGVRRPLRFLAYKLGLEEPQVAELAKILDDLKTERAQAAVDHRRTLSAFADAVAGDGFDRVKAESGAKLRLDSADRVRAAVLAALERLHAILDPEQRARLAYLIRTGTLSL
jgi:Spy/CpxP family protein refolding chaperone